MNTNRLHAEFKLQDINLHRMRGDHGSQMEAMVEAMCQVSEKLFIYGTLAPGEINHHLLDPLAGKWTRATVNGHLVKKGWGQHFGMPGIHLNSNGDPVPGHLFVSEGLSQHWTMLDQFEGQDYCRLLAVTTLETGVQDITNVYVLRELTHGLS